MDEKTKLRTVQKNLTGLPEPMKESYLRGKGPRPAQPVAIWRSDDGLGLRHFIKALNARKQRRPIVHPTSPDHYIRRIYPDPYTLGPKRRPRG
jgi:hypothetical protein